MTARRPVKCRHCGRTIQPDSPYWERQVGPVCGGIIHTGRPGPTPTVRSPGREIDEDQLTLDLWP